jgi:predicted transcriptional regulator
MGSRDSPSCSIASDFVADLEVQLPVLTGQILVGGLYDNLIVRICSLEHCSYASVTASERELIERVEEKV